MAVLQSDHVDYLVWRYLQERGYGRAAVELQRAWTADSDPQALPFSATIKPHTLVSVVQDGLMWDELASSVEQQQQQQQHASISGVQRAASSRRYLFLDENYQRKRRASLASERHELSRPTSSHQNEGARKRPRLDLNGLKGQSSSGRRKSSKNAPTITSAGPDAMDLDRRSSSRSEALLTEDADTAVKEEPPPPPSTLELGHSAPMQTDPIIDQTIAKTLSSFSIPHADIIHATWDHENPALLTVSGGSVFKTYNVPGYSPDSDITTEPSSTAIVEAIGSFYVTARSQCGRRLAYALKLESGVEECSVHVILEDGEDHLLSTPGDITLFLRWNPSGTLLLGSSIARSGGHGLLYIWHIASEAETSPVRIKTPALDGLWLDDTRFLVSGDGMLDVFVAADGALKRQARINTDKSWDTIRLDAHSGRLACLSPEERLFGILNLNNDQLQTSKAHEDTITAMEWQHGPADDSERLLATASSDGSLKLWSTHGILTCISTFHMSPMVPMAALAFSQDGKYVAAAGEGRVQTWQSRATGERVAHWADPKIEKEAEEHGLSNGTDTLLEVDLDSPLHALAWNSTGQTLVYTRGDKVALIAVPQP